MGQSHSRGDLEEFLQADLGLLPGCSRLYSDTDAGSAMCCMVPRSWYRGILEGGAAQRIPSSWPDSSELGELKLQLATSLDEEKSETEASAVAGSVRVCVKVIRKRQSSSEDVPRVHRVAPKSKATPSMATSFSAYLCYKAAENETRQWDSLRRKLQADRGTAEPRHPEGSRPAVVTADHLEMMLARLGLIGAAIVPLSANEADLCQPPAPGDAPSIGCALSRPSLRSRGGLCSVDFVLESDEAFYIFSPHQQHNLQFMLMYSTRLLSASNARPLFIVFQILQVLKRLHDSGLTHGQLKPANVLLDPTLWVTITGVRSTISNATRPVIAPIPRPRLDPAASIDVTSTESFGALLKAWVNGWIGNFDYLMGINRLAGRSMSDPAHHPILPWVVDFTSPTGGWRDFTRSKYRLNKGDQQLDFTYGNGSSTDGLVKYHVSDILSEITYFVYYARRTPKKLLCRHVRSNWVPEEYPSAMDRLYTWTPDECVPAFYTDPTIFNSIHEDLPGLGLPDWVDTPEDFVKWHMGMLESDHVSSQLHHWIDLNFGYKLTGRAAVEAKNVVLDIVKPKSGLSCNGVLQLFKTPHPARALSSAFEDPPSQTVTGQHKQVDARRNLSSGQGAGRPAEKSSGHTSTPLTLFGPDSALDKLFRKKTQAADGEKSPSKGSSRNTDFFQSKDKQRLPGGSAIRDTQPASPGVFPGAHIELSSILETKQAATKTPSGGSGAASKLGEDVEAGRGLSGVAAGASGAASPSGISWGGAGGRHRNSKIPLPLDFNPTRSIRQVELINAFLQVVEGVRTGSPAVTVADDAAAAASGPAKDASNAFKDAVAEDMRSVGCITAELFLGEFTKTWLARSTVSNHLHEQESHLAGLFKKHAPALPLCVRDGVLRLVSQNPEDRPSAQELLYTRAPQPLISFPSYFEKLYEFIAQFKQAPLDRRPDIVRKALKFLISLSEEGLSIVMPMILDLFQTRESQRQALDLFDALGRRLGVIKCNKLFRVPLFDLHEKTANPDVLAKLFSKRVLLSLVARFGLEIYIENFLQFLIDGLVHPSDAVARAAVHGTAAVAKVLGPVLSARLIIRPVLRLLTKDRGVYPVAALSIISHELGGILFLKMYLPHIQSNIESYVAKMGPKSEFFMRNTAMLLRRTLGHMPADELQSIIEELLVTIFQPVLSCLVSVHGAFSNNMRPLLSRLYVELIMCMSRTIGREASHECLLSILQLFFSAFDWIHATPLMNPTPIRKTRGGASPDQYTAPKPETAADLVDGAGAEDLSVLAEAFDVKLAAFAYSNFCQLVGQETMRRSLYNSSLVEQLMYDAEPNPSEILSLPAFIPARLSMYGENAQVLTSEFERFDGVFEVSLGTPEDHSMTRSTALKQSQDAGAGAGASRWTLHLDDQIAAKTRFPVLDLQYTHVETFHGHSSAIKASVVFNSEQSIVSGSKDKTVKIWSVNHGQSFEDTCRRTYLGHRKSVFEVMHVARSGHITSCDGSIHVWDPENGYCLRQYEFRRNPAVTLSYITERNALIAGTQESTLKLLDVRVGKSVNEWRPSSASHGSIRSVEVDDTSSWVVVGFSSGLVSLLDVRTGLLLYCWRAHESEVTKIKPLSGQRFLTCSTDHTAALWSWGTHDSIVSATSRFKGGADPIISLETCKDKLYLTSSNSRIMSYSGYDSKESKIAEQPRKIKGIKGSISTFSLLPMNQLMLFGSESGTLSLYR